MPASRSVTGHALMGLVRLCIYFNDESLTDLVNAARGLEQSLEEENSRYAGLFNRMSLSLSVRALAHRYFCHH